jgi:DNA-binding helix-hairpin-helix protein with protein kinase domain
MDLKLLQSGETLRLGQQLGRGGEGTVFAVHGRPGEVAKLYTTPPGPTKVRKLSAMTVAANPELLGIAAWPSDLLVDRTGNVLGFVMPRVSAKQDIHELYSPKSRSEAFPDADFRFVVGVAANVARAFGTLHREGHVVGDVNHGNVLVGPDGTVMLIDCDSFQVRDGAEVFSCDVGVPLFTAPELQGYGFRGLLRTENHDRFGLAVLLFHLLYLGRHPYAGRYAGAEDMPIERAIAEFRFAYGPDRWANGMERPPGAIPLETMGPEVGRLFEGAFGRLGAGEGRPDAQSWVRVLSALLAGLRRCAAVESHYYPPGVDTCPWCETEAQTGAHLFGRRPPGVAEGVANLDEIMEAIDAVAGAGAAPPLPSERPRAGAVRPRRPLRGTALVGRRRPSAAGAARAAAWAEWDRLVARWRREASGDAFDERRSYLVACAANLADLPNRRSQRLVELEAGREASQLRRYLDRFRIAGANITGIGPGRASMLASYGIETAADVSRKSIAAIPGFNRMLTLELVRWRRDREASFTFNPNQPVDRRDIQAMDVELAALRKELLAELREGPTSLRAVAAQTRVARERLMPLLEDAWAALERWERR